MIKHCPYYNCEVDCDTHCSECAFAYNPKIYGRPYKCPCGGEFAYPFYRTTSDFRLIKVCPFCGKEMVGLSNE